jgi:hypothetical protein
VYVVRVVFIFNSEDFVELISGAGVKVSGVRGIISGVRGNEWGNGVHI